MTTTFIPPQARQLASDTCELIKGLVSVEQAQELMIGAAFHHGTLQRIPLNKAAGRVLGKNQTAPVALPRFDNSAMDGYALAGVGHHSAFNLAGRVAAGDSGALTLRSGEAARIMTGAPLPVGCEAVVMQENVTVDDCTIIPHRTVQPRDNIRNAGEDVAKGELLAYARTRLDARAIAILASAGIATVEVVRKLKIRVMSTGNELVETGLTLAQGQITDVNRPMILAALSDPALTLIDGGIVCDEPEALELAISMAATSCDILIMTGGASVGDADFTADVIRKMGGQLQVHKVALKPGKPFLFGSVKGMTIFGLPGNPVSAFVTALLFVRPYLRASLGLPRRQMAFSPATAAFAEHRSAGRTEFVPARVVGTDAAGYPLIEKLGRGGSARLSPLVFADGLARIEAETTEVRPGERLSFFPFETPLSLG